MSRIIQDQQNLWGSQGSQVEPQRSDLWTVDFRQAIAGMNDQIDGDVVTLDKLADKLESYYVASVSLPPLAVRAEEVSRDSRPYKMPGCDEPLSEIKMVFIYDSTVIAASSKVYKFLDTWRQFVRAGRGAMGSEDAIPQLNSNYRIDYAFDINVTLLRGSSAPIVDFAETQGPIVDQFNSVAHGVTNDLEQTAIYSLENAWLSSFRISDLDYSKGSDLLKVEAIFYAENILNEPIA